MDTSHEGWMTVRTAPARIARVLNAAAAPELARHGWEEILTVALAIADCDVVTLESDGTTPR